MIDHLLFHAFDQAPAVLVRLLMRFFRFEALVGGQEGRLVQLALLELFDQLLVFLDAHVDVVLSNIVAADFDVREFAILETFGTRREDGVGVVLLDLPPHLQFLLLLLLPLPEKSVDFEVGLRCIFLALFGLEDDPWVAGPEGML